MQASSNNIQDTARTDLNVNPSNIKVNETPLYNGIPVNQGVAQTVAFPQFIPIYPQNAVPATGNSLSSSMQDHVSELHNPIVVPPVPYVSMVSIGDGSQLSCPYPSTGEVILSHSAPAGQIRYDVNGYYAIQPPISQYNGQQQQQYIPVQYIQYTYPQPTQIIHQQPLSRPIDIPPIPSVKMEEEKTESSPEMEDSFYGLNILSDMAEQFSQNSNNLSNSDNNNQIEEIQQKIQQQIQQQQQNNSPLTKIQPAPAPKKRESRRVYETCSTCNQHKPLTEFTLKRTGEHTHTCKVCSERKKNYYKRNIVKKHKRDDY